MARPVGAFALRGESMECNHLWDKIYEEGLIGGHFVIGWQCSRCDKWVDSNSLTPEGLPGQISNIHILVGPHSGCGNCSDGSVYKKQIIHPDGRLEIIRP